MSSAGSQPISADESSSAVDEASSAVIEAKRELRATMRRIRRDLPDRAERSASITAHLVELDAVRNASTLLAYASVTGEVETSLLIDWCHRNGVEVAMPEDDVDPTWPDVIVVPGTAFTELGARLGQGGGWYDRFLPHRRSDAVMIGIGFEPQIVESLPTEAHDVVLDCIVGEAGPRFRS